MIFRRATPAGYRSSSAWLLPPAALQAVSATSAPTSKKTLRVRPVTFATFGQAKVENTFSALTSQLRTSPFSHWRPQQQTIEVAASCQLSPAALQVILATSALRRKRHYVSPARRLAAARNRSSRVLLLATIALPELKPLNELRRETHMRVCYFRSGKSREILLLIYQRTQNVPRQASKTRSHRILSSRTM